MNWTKQWEKDRRKLKTIFQDKGIVTCEIRKPGCKYDNYLSFAHAHKRDWYKTRGNEELLGDFNQVLLACIPCHDNIENDKEETKRLFELKRNRKV
jgi:hypothetical protein